MAGFDILFGNLRYLGFFDFLLPWALFTAISYGLLVKSEVFGKEVSLNGLISIIVSFFIVNYTAIGLKLGPFFTNLFGIMAIVMGGLLVAILFLGMAGVKVEDIAGGNKTALAILLVFIALIVFLSVGGSTEWITVDDTTIATMFMIIIMALAVMFIGSKSS